MDMPKIQDYFLRIAIELIDQKISQYPIFIAHQEDAIQFGKPIYHMRDHDLNWSYNASLLEELSKKQIFDKEKITSFKEVFKDPSQFACVLLISPGDIDFVFIPYQIISPPSAN